MVALQTNDLRKTYAGGVRAVDGLSLRVEAGRTAVILGPSGCGKTTLLRLVAGLEKADRGTIVLGTQSLDALPPKARDVAMVFQHHSLYPHLSVRDNLAFGLRLRGTASGEIAERVAWVAELLGIEPLLGRMPAELSGGQRQRVAIGRAIIRRTRLFLFDEPFSQLDAPLRRDMRYELRELLKQLGTTSLYVTHDYDDARALSDLVMVMNEGRAEQIGSFDEVVASPANAFVAHFLARSGPTGAATA